MAGWHGGNGVGNVSFNGCLAFALASSLGFVRDHVPAGHEDGECGQTDAAWRTRSFSRTQPQDDTQARAGTIVIKGINKVKLLLAMNNKYDIPTVINRRNKRVISIADNRYIAIDTAIATIITDVPSDFGRGSSSSRKCVIEVCKSSVLDSQSSAVRFRYRS